MKSLYKMIGITALVAVIGFSMTACGGGGGSPSNKPDTGTPGDPTDYVTYIGVDSDDYMYVLTIEDSGAARAAYTPKENDKYTLIVGTRVSTGTVRSFEEGVLTLAPSRAVADTFTATVSGANITAVDEFTYDTGSKGASATLTPPSGNSHKLIAIIGITGQTGDARVIVRPKDNSDNFVAWNEDEITNGVIVVYLWTRDSKEYTGSTSEYVVVVANDEKDWYITKEKISITQAITVIPWSSFGKWE